MSEEVGYKKPPKDTRFGGKRANKQNRKGKPKSFVELRELAQEIAHEAIGDGNKTVVQAIMRKWAGSNDARLQQAFIRVAYGDAPAAIEVSGPKGGPIEHKDVGLSDEERRIRVAKLLDAAGTRRARQTPVDGESV